MYSPEHSPQESPPGSRERSGNEPQRHYDRGWPPGNIDRPASREPPRGLALPTWGVVAICVIGIVAGTVLTVLISRQAPSAGTSPTATVIARTRCAETQAGGQVYHTTTEYDPNGTVIRSYTLPGFC